MTRARALKQAIRARAARTGERYTTARRHVLHSQQPRRSAVPPPPAAPAIAQRPAKPGVSPARVLEKTGHDLDHWFRVLDAFGAVERGHSAAARHLYDAHGVGGWYAQGITVAYERARGVRAVNQRCDGKYEVSVSKVIAASASAVIGLLTSRSRRRRLAASDPELLAALWAALDAPASKGIVVRPDGLGRFRYKWAGTTVQLYLVPKSAHKVSVVATNAGLQGPAMVEERRGRWRAVLNAVAAGLR